MAPLGPWLRVPRFPRWRRPSPMVVVGGGPRSPCPGADDPAPPDEGEYFLKVLIPSYAAGSIIGKGGQTIVQLQKETGATIKLSKSKDFYPGEYGAGGCTRGVGVSMGRDGWSHPPRPVQRHGRIDERWVGGVPVEE